MNDIQIYRESGVVANFPPSAALTYQGRRLQLTVQTRQNPNIENPKQCEAINPYNRVLNLPHPLRQPNEPHEKRSVNLLDLVVPVSQVGNEASDTENLDKPIIMTVRDGIVQSTRLVLGSLGLRIAEVLVRTASENRGSFKLGRVVATQPRRFRDGADCPVTLEFDIIPRS